MSDADERLLVACRWLEPWVAAALDSWEGGPMPSENLGKRLYYEFLGALQAVNKERGDSAHYTLDKAERVRELAEDFAQYTDEGRALMACYYIDRGWATEADVKLALEALEEP
jgi:hypothetical protein